MSEEVHVETVFREAFGPAVATLVRVFGDISLAEDAVQDAFVVAAERWPDQGVPPNPAGWIITTARNRAIDRLRRTAKGRELHEELSPLDDLEPEEVGPVSDDQLRLIFTCCHPALRAEHQVALTLRLLGGLSVEEVARSFLVSESAMARRLGRAKYKIKAAGIPYQIPADSDLPPRLRSVLSVIYLIYNAGLDDPQRTELRVEAVRLGRALVDLMPDEPEAAGLLALMLLSDSRVPARQPGGDVVRLSEQDRTLWDQNLIEEGQRLVRACIVRNRPGPYQLQAAIQAVHSDASSFEQTDWRQILTLYDDLVLFTPTAVVALNRAIALGEVEGAEVALLEIDLVAEDLDGYHLMHAARGEFLHRLGRSEDARASYERALSLANSASDRRFLALQIEGLV